MHIFDLAISYTWEFDKEFIALTEKIFQKDKLRTFIIRKNNIQEVEELLKNKKLFLTAYLDRASDEDPEFEVLTKILSRKKCYLINHHDKHVMATNKAYMHSKLLGKNIVLPKTFILPSYNEKAEIKISESDLDTLNRPFIIKPAQFSGGGQGVIKNAHSVLHVHQQRIQSKTEQYLIQEKIYPTQIDNKRAWFRVFSAFGKVIPTWWNDVTHIYSSVTKEQISKFKLQQLETITEKLARITGMDYFSTEIAITENHNFYLIDYINDQCDWRLQSNHVDGVPNKVVIEFIEQMKKKVKSL